MSMPAGGVFGSQQPGPHLRHMLIRYYKPKAISRSLPGGISISATATSSDWEASDLGHSQLKVHRSLHEKPATLKLILPDGPTSFAYLDAQCQIELVPWHFECKVNPICTSETLLCFRILTLSDRVLLPLQCLRKARLRKYQHVLQSRSPHIGLKPPFVEGWVCLLRSFPARMAATGPTCVTGLVASNAHAGLLASTGNTKGSKNIQNNPEPRSSCV